MCQVKLINDSNVNSFKRFWFFENSAWFFFKLCVNGSNSATVNQFFFYKFYWQSLSYRLFIMALSCCFFLEAVMFVNYVNFVRGHRQACEMRVAEIKLGRWFFFYIYKWLDRLSLFLRQFFTSHPCSTCIDTLPILSVCYRTLSNWPAKLDQNKVPIIINMFLDLYTCTFMHQV